MKLDDGTGSGNQAKIDANNRLRTQSITETAAYHASEDGRSYNLNTGNITLSAAGTLIYFFNDETTDFVLTDLAVGVGTGTTSDIGEITVIRNPTGGDLISDASAVAIKQNRNHGSSKTLSATTLVYKGKSGGTITGGNDELFIYQGTNGRLIASIDLVIPKGSSVAVKFDPKLSSGSVKTYAALIGYLQDVASLG